MRMFGIGFPELIIIIIVALVVLGPSKLPELARSMGKAMREFKRMSEDIKDTIENEQSTLTESPSGDLKDHDYPNVEQEKK